LHLLLEESADSGEHVVVGNTFGCQAISLARLED
jgi:hypothetical protein